MEDKVFDLLEKMYIEFSGRFDTMGKEMDSKFDVVNGRFDTMRKEMDSKFDVVSGRFDTMRKEMDSKFDVVSGRFDTMRKEMDSKFDVVSGRFDTMGKEMDSKFGVVNTRFDTIENEIKDIKSKMATKDDLNLLGTELHTEIQAVHDEVREIKIDKVDMNKLEKIVAKNTYDIEKLKLALL